MAVFLRAASPICDRCPAKPGWSAKGKAAMNMIASRVFPLDQAFRGAMTTANPDATIAAKQGVVAIVSDDLATIEHLAPVCDFLDLRIEIVSSGTDLDHILREFHPMAVITDIEGEERDGFHTMKQLAHYSRDLPILLLTAGDAVLMGAVDAVQNICGLTAVSSTSSFPVAGQLVAFLFNAGRRAGCMRLIPV
jgi:CheY-like chemotaxis protein